MTVPAQQRGVSRQDYGTPADFLAAVKARLGISSFVHDFAADATNAKAPNFWTVDADSPTQPHWDGMMPREDWGWLNPPYADIAPWAKKCRETKQRGGQIAFLVPAAIGSNWFRDYVHGYALVLALNGRLTFEGCTQPYPKDCILALYSTRVAPGFDVWNWRAPRDL